MQILLVGDSGVGKSSLLMRFTTGGFQELAPTIGVLAHLPARKVGLFSSWGFLPVLTSITWHGGMQVWILKPRLWNSRGSR
jgi:GTPase SAR1 family protein